MIESTFAAIIVAGGNGARMGAAQPKQFLEIENVPLLGYTLSVFDACKKFTKLIIVCNTAYILKYEQIAQKFCAHTPFVLVNGGGSRQQSVLNGLKKALDCDYCLIHDGVRCCIQPEQIITVCDCVQKYSACALGVKVKDTIKQANAEGFITSTLNRDCLWQIQTPQAFITKEIYCAHQSALAEHLIVTDDCAVAEHCKIPVKIIEGSYENIKITTPSDLIQAKLYWKGRNIQ